LLWEASNAKEKAQEGWSAPREAKKEAIQQAVNRRSKVVLLLAKESQILDFRRFSPLSIGKAAGLIGSYASF